MVAVTTAAVGAFALQESPLTAVQMLWCAPLYAEVPPVLCISCLHGVRRLCVCLCGRMMQPAPHAVQLVARSAAVLQLCRGTACSLAQQCACVKGGPDWGLRLCVCGVNLTGVLQFSCVCRFGMVQCALARAG